METPLPCLAVEEPQAEYGADAELFERYQSEHGVEQMTEVAGRTETQEVEKAGRKYRV